MLLAGRQVCVCRIAEILRRGEPQQRHHRTPSRIRRRSVTGLLDAPPAPVPVAGSVLGRALRDHAALAPGGRPADAGAEAAGLDAAGEGVEGSLRRGAALGPAAVPAADQAADPAQAPGAAAGAGVDAVGDLAAVELRPAGGRRGAGLAPRRMLATDLTGAGGVVPPVALPQHAAVAVELDPVARGSAVCAVDPDRRGQGPLQHCSRRAAPDEHLALLTGWVSERVVGGQRGVARGGGAAGRQQHGDEQRSSATCADRP